MAVLNLLVSLFLSTVTTVLGGAWWLVAAVVIAFASAVAFNLFDRLL